MPPINDLYISERMTRMAELHRQLSDYINAGDERAAFRTAMSIEESIQSVMRRLNDLRYGKKP